MVAGSVLADVEGSASDAVAVAGAGAGAGAVELGSTVTVGVGEAVSSALANGANEGNVSDAVSNNAATLLSIDLPGPRLRGSGSPRAGLYNDRDITNPPVGADSSDTPLPEPAIKSEASKRASASQSRATASREEPGSLSARQARLR